jgi:hypothetical protein
MSSRASIKRLARRAIRRETGREKWGGSLAAQPRWRRPTNVWREVTTPARGPKRPTSDRQRGAIFWAPPTGETPLRGQRCRSSPPFGGAKPREKPGMRTIVRSKSTQMRFVVAAFAAMLLRGFSPISDQQLIWVIPGILLVIDVAWGSQVGFRSGVSN